MIPFCCHLYLYISINLYFFDPIFRFLSGLSISNSLLFILHFLKTVGN